MSAVGAAILAAADSLPLWRDAAVAVLAGVVIGCLALIAAVTEGKP